MLSTAGCVLATALLALAGPGDLGWAIAAIVVSNVFYSFGESLTAAFLPELARRSALGRVSGWGWSFGYFGGMLTLGLSLGYVLWAQRLGLPAQQFVPVTMLITAGVYGAASLVTFALLKERARPQAAAAQDNGVRASLARLAQTWRQAQDYRDFVWLLLCAVAYQAGIAVVIALAAVYAEQVLGFVQTQTMLLIFLVNIASAVGAFVFGYWQDRLGHRRALAGTLVGWIVMTLLAAAATDAALFWVAAVVAGLRGERVWHQVLTFLADGTVPGGCPECGEDLCVFLDTIPARVCLSWVEPPDGPELVLAKADTIEGYAQGMLVMAGRHSRGNVTHRLLALLGDGQCPACERPLSRGSLFGLGVDDAQEGPSKRR